MAVAELYRMICEICLLKKTDRKKMVPLLALGRTVLGL